jgi:hypothetical protein
MPPSSKTSPLSPFLLLAIVGILHPYSNKQAIAVGPHSQEIHSYAEEAETPIFCQSNPYSPNPQRSEFIDTPESAQPTTSNHFRPLLLEFAENQEQQGVALLTPLPTKARSACKELCPELFEHYKREYIINLIHYSYERKKQRYARPRFSTSDPQEQLRNPNFQTNLDAVLYAIVWGQKTHILDLDTDLIAEIGINGLLENKIRTQTVLEALKDQTFLWIAGFMRLQINYWNSYIGNYNKKLQYNQKTPIVNGNFNAILNKSLQKSAKWPPLKQNQ